jgi:hypothetical protein
MSNMVKLSQKTQCGFNSDCKLHRSQIIFTGTAGSAQPDRNMNVAEVAIVWDSLQPLPELSKDLTKDFKGSEYLSQFKCLNF